MKHELRLGDTGFALWTVLARYVAPLGVLYVFWNNIRSARARSPA
ncbi:hypothetical protein [Thauera humireducens]